MRNDPAPITLLLLPGLDGTGDLFTDFISALPGTLRARVVRYPADRFLTYADLFACVVDAMPTTERFVVVAESFSTPLAIKLAARRPRNLTALVICAGFITSPIDGWLRLMMGLVQPLFFRVPAPAIAINYFLIGADAPSDLRAMVFKTLRRVSPEVMAARVRAVLACDVRQELVQVCVPTLYLQGKNDRLVKERCFEEIRQIKPDTTLAAISAPHFLLQREPHKAADAILGFIRELM